MANTTATPASVAARLTDEEILNLADICEVYEDNAAAVLRDYVRMRKLANAVKKIVEVINEGNCRFDDYENVLELKRLLSDA